MIAEMIPEIKIDIREPLASESAGLANASFAAWEKGVGPHVSAATREGISELDFADFIRENPDQILAAFVNDALPSVPVGYVATENGDNYISDLWVDPTYEGKGIGTALLQAMTDRIRARRFGTITIEVLTANNRALGLYQHLGYVTLWQGLRPDGHLRERVEKTGMVKTLT